MINDLKAEYFSVLVIGENHYDIISKYDEYKDSNEYYILYKYNDRNKYRKKNIEFIKEYLKTVTDNKNRNILIDKLNELKSMSDEAYYLMMGELHTFDKDKNIITNENPYGKYATCEIGGKLYKDYLKNNNGENITSEKKKNIRWDYIHLNEEKYNLYKNTWDLCVNKKQPITPEEENIIRNMSLLKDYFSNFNDCETYCKYNTSFFTDVIIKDGIWYSCEDSDYNEWVINYYDRFIKDIPDDELITIYECIK